MNMNWSPKGDLQFGVFRKKGKESNQKPGTFHSIPLGVLNRLAKLTSRKPFIRSEGVDKIYPDHTNDLRKAGLAPPNFLKMGDLWSKQDEKMDIEK